jgi:uncharacterized protein YbaP (TraB family)
MTSSVAGRPLPPGHPPSPVRCRRSAIVAAFVALALLAPLSAATRNLVWKAARGQAIVYLAGSMHLLPKDVYPLNPALDAAYKESDLLVEELDLGEMASADAQFGMLSRGLLPSSQSLDTVLSRATLALLNKHLGDVGPMAEPLKRFKPWLIAITIETLELTKIGFDPNLGLDKHFYDQARSDGKEVQGFESAAYQISLFDQMPMEQQDRLLAETLKDLDTEQASMTKLADAWKTGDAPAVERIALTDIRHEPQLYQRLIVERNRNWMPKLEALFARRGRALVIVGAGHLVGPDGLIAMLRAKGYTVEQL